MDYQTGHGSTIDVLEGHQRILKTSDGASEFGAKIITMVDQRDLSSARLWFGDINNVDR